MSMETFGKTYLESLSKSLLGFVYRALSPDSDEAKGTFDFTAEDLDRDNAEAELNESIGQQNKGDVGASATNDDAKEMAKLTERLAVLQSQQRSRRDIGIARLTHKEIVLSMLRGAYGMKRNIDVMLSSSAN